MLHDACLQALRLHSNAEDAAWEGAGTGFQGDREKRYLKHNYNLFLQEVSEPKDLLLKFWYNNEQVLRMVLCSWKGGLWLL